MNDELKEALEEFESSYYAEITHRQYELIVDYITNLQEENEELFERFSNKIEEVSNLIKENEKLKLAKDIKCASEILCKCLHNEYKSRNEKAIEVLKNTMYPDIAKAKALNILQGEDKDE